MKDRGVSQVVVIGKEIIRDVYSSFYELPGEPKRFGKKANAIRRKRYPFGITINFPLNLYLRFKYGIADIVRYEYDRLQEMPEDLRDYLLKNVTLARSPTGATVLCADRVWDFDGAPSRSLTDLGAISNPAFWEGVSHISEILLRNRLYLFGVFHGGGKILVQKVSADRWRPVILDVVKAGWTLYPFQVHLAFEYWLRRKFERRMTRFIGRFQA